MRRIFHGRAGTALAFMLGLLVATAGTATAAKLITGKQIKDGSISSKDLSKAVRAQLTKTGVTGPAGSQGAKGDPGSKGDTGTKGETGTRGHSAWDTIPAGQTVTGAIEYDAESSVAGDFRSSVAFPARAPMALTATTVNFAADAKAETTDDDPTCTGDAATPTAPAGKVCVYLGSTAGDTTGLSARNTLDAVGGSQSGITLRWDDSAVTPDVYVYASWAYTAP